jgi:hypothetical protein
VDAGSGADLCCVGSFRNTDWAGAWIIPGWRWASAVLDPNNLTPNPFPSGKGNQIVGSNLFPSGKGNRIVGSNLSPGGKGNNRGAGQVES